jgi:hypothetical protein
MVLLVGLLGPTDHDTDHGVPDRPAPVATSDHDSDHDGLPTAPRPCAPPRQHCSMARAAFPAPGPQPLAVVTGSRDLLPGASLATPLTATADSAEPAPTPASLQVFRL